MESACIEKTLSAVQERSQQRRSTSPDLRRGRRGPYKTIPFTAATLDEKFVDMPRSKLHPGILRPFPIKDVTNDTVVLKLPHRRENVAIYRVVKDPGRPSDLLRIPPYRRAVWRRGQYSRLSHGQE